MVLADAVSEPVHVPLLFCPMATGRPDVVTIEQAFTEEELARIEEACARLPLQHVVEGPEGAIEHNRRDVHVGLLSNVPDTAWLFLKLMTHLQKANMTLRVAVWGIAELAEYAVYRQGRHCWHVDSAMRQDGQPYMPKKLTFELLLSGPADYEGGARELLGGGSGRFAARPARGSLIVFPSYVLTRVYHVTAGERRSLEGWVSGPEFQ